MDIIYLIIKKIFKKHKLKKNLNWITAQTKCALILSMHTRGSSKKKKSIFTKATEWRYSQINRGLNSFLLLGRSRYHYAVHLGDIESQITIPSIPLNTHASHSVLGGLPCYFHFSWAQFSKSAPSLYLEYAAQSDKSFITPVSSDTDSVPASSINAIYPLTAYAVHKESPARCSSL